MLFSLLFRMLYLIMSMYQGPLRTSFRGQNPTHCLPSMWHRHDRPAWLWRRPRRGGSSSPNPLTVARCPCKPSWCAGSKMKGSTIWSHHAYIQRPRCLLTPIQPKLSYIYHSVSSRVASNTLVHSRATKVAKTAENFAKSGSPVHRWTHRRRAGGPETTRRGSQMLPNTKPT